MSDPRWGDGETFALRELEREHARDFEARHGFRLIERNQDDEGTEGTRRFEEELAAMIGLSPEDML